MNGRNISKTGLVVVLVSRPANMQAAVAKDVKFSAGFFDVASEPRRRRRRRRDKNHKSGHSFCEKRGGGKSVFLGSKPDPVGV